MIERAENQDQRSLLVAYLASKMGTTPAALVGHMPFEVVACKIGGKPMGAVLYTNWRETSIEMSGAGEPGWLSKGTLREMFAYPFHTLKVYTALTLVARRNKVSRAFNVKLGFVELCTIPSGERENDTILYGMTRSQCPWIETERSRPVVHRAQNGAHAHG